MGEVERVSSLEMSLLVMDELEACFDTGLSSLTGQKSLVVHLEL